VLDGEIVCLDNGAKPQFCDLPFKRGEPSLCAFDLLWLDGEDLRYTPPAERKAKLHGLLPESGRLFYCDHVEQHGEAPFELSCQKDLEGVVAKRKSILIGHAPNSSDIRRDPSLSSAAQIRKVQEVAYLLVLQAVLVVWPQSEARSGFGVWIALGSGERRMP